VSAGAAPVAKKPGIWDAQTRAVYRRLLGYSARHWPIALVALVGMLLDGGGLAAFTQLIQPMIDDLFVAKDPWVIRWMPLWILCIFFLRSIGTFLSDYGMAYIGRHVV